jgi:hypothetical protein
MSKMKRRYDDWNWGDINLSKGVMAKVAREFCVQGADAMLEQVTSEGKIGITPFGWAIEFDIYIDDGDPHATMTAPLEGTLIEAIREWSDLEHLSEIETILNRALQAIKERRNLERLIDHERSLLARPTVAARVEIS